MIEEIISKLDIRGLMVLSILIGKRHMELLKNETIDTKVSLSIPKDTKGILTLDKLTGLTNA